MRTVGLPQNDSCFAKIFISIEALFSSFWSLNSHWDCFQQHVFVLKEREGKNRSEFGSLHFFCALYSKNVQNGRFHRPPVQFVPVSSCFPLKPRKSRIQIKVHSSWCPFRENKAAKQGKKTMFKPPFWSAVMHRTPCWIFPFQTVNFLWMDCLRCSIFHRFSSTRLCARSRKCSKKYNHSGRCDSK